MRDTGEDPKITILRLCAQLADKEAAIERMKIPGERIPERWEERDEEQAKRHTVLRLREELAEARASVVELEGRIQPLVDRILELEDELAILRAWAQLGSRSSR